MSRKYIDIADLGFTKEDIRQIIDERDAEVIFNEVSNTPVESITNLLGQEAIRVSVDPTTHNAFQEGSGVPPAHATVGIKLARLNELLETKQISKNTYTVLMSRISRTKVMRDEKAAQKRMAKITDDDAEIIKRFNENVFTTHFFQDVERAVVRHHLEKLTPLIKMIDNDGHELRPTGWSAEFRQGEFEVTFSERFSGRIIYQ
ncbi:hypothetical protein ACFL4H_00095 [Candidatus Neomarinimicrobiota bacterium]